VPRKILSASAPHRMFRLPIHLTVKAVDCGRSNAWYQRPVATLCYEYWLAS